LRPCAERFWCIRQLGDYQAALVTADNAYVDAVQSAATTAGISPTARARSILACSQRRLRRFIHENRIGPYPTGDTGKRATPVAASSGVVAAGVVARPLLGPAAPNVMSICPASNLPDWTDRWPDHHLLTITGLLGGTFTYNIVSPMVCGAAPTLNVQL